MNSVISGYFSVLQYLNNLQNSDFLPKLLFFWNFDAYFAFLEISHH